MDLEVQGGVPSDVRLAQRYFPDGTSKGDEPLVAAIFYVCDVHSLPPSTVYLSIPTRAATTHHTVAVVGPWTVDGGQLGPKSGGCRRQTSQNLQSTLLEATNSPNLQNC